MNRDRPDRGGTCYAQNLNAVAARSATDVWAVGATSQSDDSQPLAVHWNGRSWTRVPTPALKIGGYFNAPPPSEQSEDLRAGR